MDSDIPVVVSERVALGRMYQLNERNINAFIHVIITKQYIIRSLGHWI